MASCNLAIRLLANPSLRASYNVASGDTHDCPHCVIPHTHTHTAKIHVGLPLHSNVSCKYNMAYKLHNIPPAMPKKRSHEGAIGHTRSEEHTSELQSHVNLV